MKTMSIRDIKYSLVLSLLALSSFHSCTQDEDKHAPSERTREAIQSLTQELQQEQASWVMTYFPSADSLIFSNPNHRYGHHEYRPLYGLGGRYYALSFIGNDLLMRADDNSQTIQAHRTSSYRVQQHTTLILSFTSHTYIHDLVNNRFLGSSDFLYQGKGNYNELFFTTPKYKEYGHEFIRLERLKTDDNAEAALSRALKNREVFEEMTNPQLLIRYGAREYFRSNYYVKRKVSTNLSFIRDNQEKRYYAFLYSAQPGEESFSSFRGFSILGSGYTGTKDGLLFFPGISYNSNIRFRDFEYRDGRYVSELVTVYDPLLRKTRLESKHLYPDGIATGYTAEIWDAGHQ